ncbi:hypothetical protein [Roseicyclus persicicus]|uniref:Uncharacterized protein n=1 Tax=Roseicyclus persicicus TaxID=2650661 RepID=A0A7X6K060_9RHOB|nr:hypothetical protein [Roseibacterium persicicum]NKX46289.1 hypothetical protein [Roseibacterium persicicum]
MRDTWTPTGWQRSLALALRRFGAEEDGLSTVDWVVIAAGATAMGIMTLSTGRDTATDYSADIRTELEGGRFVAPWLDALPVQQP